MKENLTMPAFGNVKTTPCASFFDFVKIMATLTRQTINGEIAWECNEGLFASTYDCRIPLTDVQIRISANKRGAKLEMKNIYEEMYTTISKKGDSLSFFTKSLMNAILQSDEYANLGVEQLLEKIRKAESDLFALPEIVRVKELFAKLQGTITLHKACSDAASLYAKRMKVTSRDVFRTKFVRAVQVARKIVNCSLSANPEGFVRLAEGSESEHAFLGYEDMFGPLSINVIANVETNIHSQFEPVFGADGSDYYFSAEAISKRKDAIRKSVAFIIADILVKEEG